MSLNLHGLTRFSKVRLLFFALYLLVKQVISKTLRRVSK